MWIALGVIALIWYVSTQLGESGDIPLSSVQQIDPRVQSLAQAIALAENGSSLMNVRNNPGNIRDLTTGQLADYPDEQTGWSKLYNKIQYDFVDGLSSIYSPSMTWRQVGWMWVNGTAVGAPLVNVSDQPDAWASTVAGQIGVDVTSTVAEYFA